MRDRRTAARSRARPIPIRTLVVSLLLIGLAVAPAALPGAAAVTPKLGDSAPPTACVQPTASGTTGEPAVTGTISQVTATTYRIEYDLSNATDRAFDVLIPRGVTVAETTGFQRAGDRYYSRNESAERPSLTLSTDVRYGEQRFTWKHSSDWIFGILPRYPGSGPAVSHRPATEGYVGDELFYLGAYSTATREVGCQEITQVFPESATVSVEHDALLDAYAWTARRLDTGYATREVHGFAVPGVDPRASGQGFTRGADFVVFTPNELRTAANPWLHEYVHTRQRFDATADARWFTEGSATYLAARAALEQGLVTPQAYDAHLASARSRWPGRDTLAEPEYLQTPYLRGLTVLSRLDVALEPAPNESVLGMLRDANGRGSITQRQLENWTAAGRARSDSFDFHRAVATTTEVRPGYVLGPAWLPPIGRRVLPGFTRPTVRVVFGASGIAALLLGWLSARN